MSPQAGRLTLGLKVPLNWEAAEDRLVGAFQSSSTVLYIPLYGFSHNKISQHRFFLPSTHTQRSPFIFHGYQSCERFPWGQYCFTITGEGSGAYGINPKLRIILAVNSHVCRILF